MMGEVIHVQFGNRNQEIVNSDAQSFMQLMKAELDPDDFQDLQQAIIDWDHFQGCDPVIQELASTYFTITNKL